MPPIIRPLRPAGLKVRLARGLKRPPDRVDVIRSAIQDLQTAFPIVRERVAR